MTNTPIRLKGLHFFERLPTSRSVGWSQLALPAWPHPPLLHSAATPAISPRSSVLNRAISSFSPADLAESRQPLGQSMSGERPNDAGAGRSIVSPSPPPASA